MSLVLFIQAFVCGLIVLRVLLFQRKGRCYRVTIAVQAYLIMVTSAAVVIGIVCGLYQQAQWATLILLIEFLYALCCSRGNIAQLYRHKPITFRQYKPCKFSCPLAHKKTASKFQLPGIPTKQRLQNAP